MLDHVVLSAGPGGDVRTELELEGEPAGLGWLPDGRLLVVSRLDRVVLRQEHDGSVVEHGRLTPWATFHGNDMVVDATGGAYVGNFGFDLDAFTAEHRGSAIRPDPPRTSLVRLEPDGTASEAATDLAFPNGMVLTPDGRTLIVAESTGRRLSAFAVAPDGTLSERREWASLVAERAAPDGICLDAEGAVWVANAIGAECLRVAEGGEVLARVSTPDRSIACMLGGGDRRTLYCVHAPEAGADRARVARRGGISTARVDVPGAGLP